MAYTKRRRTSKNKMRKSRSNRSNNKNKSKNSWPMFVKKVYHEDITFHGTSSMFM